MENSIEELRYMESSLNSLSGVQHVHDKSYEILFVLEGEGSMLIGNNLYSVTKNTVFLTAKTEIHNITPISKNYVRDILNINDEYVEKLTKLTNSEDLIKNLFSKRCIRLTDDAAERIKVLFSQIKKALESRENKGIQILLHLLNLFELLLNTEASDVSALNNAVSKAVSYIDKNLSSPLSLEMICEHVHLSKYHFSRIFREKTGMSPFGYIIECRISKAKKLLTGTNDTISNIAVAVGFSTSSNFCNTFRKYEKISPTEFRIRNTINQ